MGATLFHLLAGRPPFAAETRDDLSAQHCNDLRPDCRPLTRASATGSRGWSSEPCPSTPRIAISTPGRCSATSRPCSTASRRDLAIHPRLPDCDPQPGPPVRVPMGAGIVAAAALAPGDQYRPARPGDRVCTGHENRRVSSRAAACAPSPRAARPGMVEVGEEHPYEWVEPRRMGVLREYSQGPFRWLVSVVELSPRPGGGTTLVHRLRLEPSSWKIRVGSRWGVGVGLRRAWSASICASTRPLKSQPRARAFAPGRSLRGAGPAPGSAASAARAPAGPTGRAGH